MNTRGRRNLPVSCAALLFLTGCEDPHVAQTIDAETVCGTAMRVIPMPVIERIILRISGDVSETSVAEIIEYYRPRFAEIGIGLQEGEKTCAPGDLYMYYDLSRPGAGRMITCRAGREFKAALNGDQPSIDLARIGLENVYQQEKCRRRGGDLQ